MIEITYTDDNVEDNDEQNYNTDKDNSSLFTMQTGWLVYVDSILQHSTVDCTL